MIALCRRLFDRYYENWLLLAWVGIAFEGLVIWVRFGGNPPEFLPAIAAGVFAFAGLIISGEYFGSNEFSFRTLYTVALLQTMLLGAIFRLQTFLDIGPVLYYGLLLTAFHLFGLGEALKPFPTAVLAALSVGILEVAVAFEPALFVSADHPSGGSAVFFAAVNFGLFLLLRRRFRQRAMPPSVV